MDLSLLLCKDAVRGRAALTQEGPKRANARHLVPSFCCLNQSALTSTKENHHEHCACATATRVPGSLVRRRIAFLDRMQASAIECSGTSEQVDYRSEGEEDKDARGKSPGQDRGHVLRLEQWKRRFDEWKRHFQPNTSSRDGRRCHKHIVTVKHSEHSFRAALPWVREKQTRASESRLASKPAELPLFKSHKWRSSSTTRLETFSR